MIGSDITVTEMLFSSADDDLVEKPMVRLSNLGKKFTKLLQSQEESLTWFGGAILENEVWVKVGEDHGQGTTQFMNFNLAVVNTKKKKTTKKLKF